MPLITVANRPARLQARARLRLVECWRQLQGQATATVRHQLHASPLDTSHATGAALCADDRCSKGRLVCYLEARSGEEFVVTYRDNRTRKSEGAWSLSLVINGQKYVNSSTTMPCFPDAQS